MYTYILYILDIVRGRRNTKKGTKSTQYLDTAMVGLEKEGETGDQGKGKGEGEDEEEESPRFTLSRLRPRPRLRLHLQSSPLRSSS